MNSTFDYLSIILICNVLIILIQQFSIRKLEKKITDITSDLVETKLQTIAALGDLTRKLNNKD